MSETFTTHEECDLQTYKHFTTKTVLHCDEYKR